jgi:hypothetical protein
LHAKNTLPTALVLATTPTLVRGGACVSVCRRQAWLLVLGERGRGDRHVVHNCCSSWTCLCPPRPTLLILPFSCHPLKTPRCLMRGIAPSCPAASSFPGGLSFTYRALTARCYWRTFSWPCSTRSALAQVRSLTDLPCPACHSACVP